MNWMAFRVIALGMMIMLVASCGGGGGGGGGAGNNQQRTTMSTPVSTAVGTVSGPAAQAVIGASGGSLSSLDSAVTVSIPAGALAANTQIEITPLSNTSHGGIGVSYRLTTTPAVTFQQPVTLTFTYADNQLGGTPAAALGAAYQTADGYWRWQPNAVIDTTAKTVTVTTTHFSDWSKVKGFQIRPPSATVKVSQTVALQVQYCYIPEPYQAKGEELAQLTYGYACGADLEADLVQDLDALIPSATVSNWSVNGTAGGNATVGTVAGSGSKATYTAPVMKPTPDTVAVSAEVDLGPKGKTLVVANITVTGGDIVGRYTFSGTIIDSGSTINYAGEASLDFILTRDWDTGTEYTLSAAPSTQVRFTQWDYTDSQKSCSLVADAVTPFSFIGTFTIIKPTSSYAFAGALQVEGTHRCFWAGNQQVTTELAGPLAVLTTANGAGDTLGMRSLPASGNIIGTGTLIDQGTTQHNEWVLTR